MNILLTGATGFIGSRFLEDALQRRPDFKFVCPCRTTPKSRFISKDKKVPDSPQFPVGDLSDPQFLNELTKDIQAVVHCAGKAGAWGPYADYFKANVEITQRLLQSCRKNGVGRFINISSPSIYFEFKDQKNLVESDLPKHFSNFYAQTKWEAEELVRKAHGPDLTTVSLRPRFVVGRGDNNVLPRMIALARRGLLFQVGDGHSEIDITSVANLTGLMMTCLEAPASQLGQTYNVSNGRPVNMKNFQDSVLKAVGVTAKHFFQIKKLPRGFLMAVAHVNAGAARLLRIKEEPRLLPLSVAVLSQSMTLNIDRARRQLGYEAQVSTEEAIQEFAHWWKTQESAL